MGLIAVVNLTGARFTTTAIKNQVALDGYYVSPGSKECFAVQQVMNCNTVVTDLGSIIGTIQASPTTVASDFATISGATFTAVVSTDIPNGTNASVIEQKSFLIPANTANLRYTGTVTSNPLFNVSCNLFMVKRVS